MAKAPDSLENLLSCQVCFEEFEEDGDHIPRILPCYHTLCQTCIAEMIARNRQNKIECPECRAEHEAKNQTKSFPQNKYLVIQARRKTLANEEVPVPVDLCPEHGKELILFCKEARCQKSICSKCLKENHKKHEVVDTEDENKEVLLKNVNSMKIDLRAKMPKVLSAKEEVGNKAKECANSLRKKKDEVIKQFDKMIKQAEDRVKETNILVDDDVMALNENLILLESIEQGVEVNTNEDILDKLETVRVLSENVKQHLSGSRTYLYPQYEGNPSAVEALCGNITQQEMIRELETATGVCNQLDIATAAVQPAAPLLGHRAITHALQLQCRVTWSVESTFSSRYVSSLTLLPNGRVAVCGVEELGGCKLKVYDQRDGQELSNVALQNQPFGIAAITLGGRNTVALSSDFRKIGFRDVTDLNQIVHSYSVAPHQPGTLCTAGPSTLLYADWNKNPREVRWLDCSGAEPKPVVGKNVIGTGQEKIHDMCCVQNGDEQLLITANGEGGVNAYNMENGQLEWRVEGKMPGMEREMYALGLTSDERGNLFVCDYEAKNAGNGCIQMFTVCGEYLGVLLRKGEQGLGNLWRIRWSESTSSLVVSDMKKEKYHTSQISVQ